MLCISNGNCESFVQLYILGSLMTSKVKYDLICSDYSAPCRIHDICIAIGIVCSDHHDRLWHQHRFCTKILTHIICLLNLKKLTILFYDYCHLRAIFFWLKYYSPHAYKHRQEQHICKCEIRQISSSGTLVLSRHIFE